MREEITYDKFRGLHSPGYKNLHFQVDTARVHLPGNDYNKTLVEKNVILTYMINIMITIIVSKVRT